MPNRTLTTNPAHVHMGGDLWRSWMKTAARIALRGHGNVEPNPMVGCVVLDAREQLAGWGCHRKIGGAHAEIEALKRAGAKARGGTAIVTLEPCAHFGRTPPCVDALRNAGVARVVYGAEDPNPEAAGGAAKLREAGIEAILLRCPECDELNEPFLKRVRTGLPWVLAKWAQTVDGCVATRNYDSQWISGERSRRMVHRERGRVDAILTGIGTVMHDDPQLTARGVRLRRNAIRVVIDPELVLPLTASLVRTARQFKTVVATLPKSFSERSEHRRALGDLGVGCMKQHSDFRGLLAALRKEYGVHTVLVEAGGGLTGELLKERLIDEAWVFVGPKVVGDREAIHPARGLSPLTMDDAIPLRLLSVRRRGPDALLHYRFDDPNISGSSGNDIVAG
ncbi:MAG: bifunctional diaminohydroxyphosphoribosylaminopyrimidine deaminase/5-amino-6-(5-phosphoribosylamino)uracil reductase RibD [Planctomycetes bacterium]|nr:bifunctional diaminohydroxyphosphoribosylaminopyrimidine deaminase/5-amino-6-(5-phosphoribosylamino)uracil reductase RibD [Planctomycetota bacterium]